jgi:[ribosomal protein S5]-alanine N-acetyltransferase
MRTGRSSSTAPLELPGRRVVLRTLRESDYEPWHEIRVRCRDWLVPWEPRPAGAAPAAEDRGSFAARCALRERERQIGSGYGFGIFVDQRLVGELTLSSIQRGPFQSASIGYWIDRDWAGRSLMPEAVVVALRFAFEMLGLHRVEVSIIPRNTASRRVAEKLDLRLEGVSERYLEIDGVWEDHLRYAMTSEEWQLRGDELVNAWLISAQGAPNAQ